MVWEQNTNLHSKRSQLKKFYLQELLSQTGEEKIRPFSLPYFPWMLTQIDLYLSSIVLAAFEFESNISIEVIKVLWILFHIPPVCNTIKVCISKYRQYGGVQRICATRGQFEVWIEFINYTIRYS